MVVTLLEHTGVSERAQCYILGFHFLANVGVFLPSGDPNKPSGFRSVKAPVTKVAASVGNAQKLPMCDKCGTGIV